MDGIEENLVPAVTNIEINPQVPTGETTEVRTLASSEPMFIRCPYNGAHLVRKSKMMAHLNLCRGTYLRNLAVPGLCKIHICKYDVVHHVHQSEYESHILNCPTRPREATDTIMNNTTNEANNEGVAGDAGQVPRQDDEAEIMISKPMVDVPFPGYFSKLLVPNFVIRSKNMSPEGSPARDIFSCPKIKSKDGNDGPSTSKRRKISFAKNLTTLHSPPDKPPTGARSRNRRSDESPDRPDAMETDAEKSVPDDYDAEADSAGYEADREFDDEETSLTHDDVYFD